MNDKMKDLAIRTLSGIVLAAVVLGAIVWSPWSFGALLALLLVFGMLEFYTLAEARGARPQRVLGTVLGLALFILCFVMMHGNRFDSLQLGLAEIVLLLLGVPVMLICELYRKNPDPIASVGTTLLGIWYVAFPLACFGMITTPFFAGAGWSWKVAIGYIAMIWANDVLAYLVGMTIGRHRLFERLSPKKSWEGFFGGVVGAAAAGVLAARIFDGNLWAWVGMALVISTTGVLGDLAESMFKRAAGVKDSGTLIPGHGGVLDRFDAVLLSAPFVVAYLLFCRIVFGVGF